jgi:hypothetical protein
MVRKQEAEALKQKGIHVGDIVRTAYHGGVREGSGPLQHSVGC